MAVSDTPDVSSDDAGLLSLHDTSNISLFCDSCKEDGHYYEAVGYCVDCTHHLCKSCFQQHRTPRPMRHHKLLDKEQMPQTKPVKVFKDECTVKCSVHGDEIMKYFCEDHNIFGCTVCVTLGHRSCNVGYIPTLSADLFNTQEYKSFKLVLQSMVRNTNSVQDTATRNLENANKRAEAAIAEVRKLRKEIDNYFDELENKMLSRLTLIRDENQESIVEILKENKIITDKLKEFEKEMNEKEDQVQKCRLFVDIKQLNKTICELKKDIDIMEKNNKVKDLTFKPSDSLTSFISNKSETFGSLGSFHESFSLDIECLLVDDIAVLSRKRMAIQCKISGTRRIVIIDTKQTPTQVMTTMESSFINGLTKVSEKEIAVTTVAGNMEIYSVTDKLVLKKTIKNTKLYHAIVYTNGVFIGCTLEQPYNLRMVNMNGDLMKTLPIQMGKEPYRPCCIAVNSDLTAMYVSDGAMTTVTCLTFEGEVKGKYKPGSKWEPSGVAFSSDGLVYVSDNENNSIHILTSDLKPHDVIIGTRYGILGPRGLAVCESERKLYVGMRSGKSISVFNI